VFDHQRGELLGFLVGTAQLQKRVPQVVDHLRHSRAAEGPLGGSNQRAWDGLVNELASWLREKQAFAGVCDDAERRFLGFASRGVEPDDAGAGLAELGAKVVRSYQLGSARRSRSAEQWGLRNLLPTAIALEDGAPARPGELLLALHAAARFLAGAEPRTPGAARSVDPAGERRLLESTRLNESLQDTLNAVVGRLEDFVAEFEREEAAGDIAAL